MTIDKIKAAIEAVREAGGERIDLVGTPHAIELLRTMGATPEKSTYVHADGQPARTIFSATLEIGRWPYQIRVHAQWSREASADEITGIEGRGHESRTIYRCATVPA